MIFKYKGISAHKVGQNSQGIFKKIFRAITSVFRFRTKLGAVKNGEDPNKIKEQLAMSRRFWVTSSSSDFVEDIVEADSHQLAILKLINNGIFPFEIEDISNLKERVFASKLNNLRSFKKKLENGIK